jgi:hypothetical protein
MCTRHSLIKSQIEVSTDAATHSEYGFDRDWSIMVYLISSNLFVGMGVVFV